MKKHFSKAAIIWIPFAAVITFACLLGYILVQQDLRQTANDPQTQIATDVAADLAQGAPPQEIVSQSQAVDISSSLDPFVIIYDASGMPLASSAALDGATPKLPPAVFAYVAQHGEDSFTWQPAPGVRNAVIVEPWTNDGAGNPTLGIPTSTPSSGFVLAGRSLREIEIREDNILHIAELAWLLGIIVMFFIVIGAVSWYEKRK
jgi:hypothetical protein